MKIANSLTKSDGARPWILAGVAAALAASAMYVRRQTRKTERENPPAGRFVNADGVRLHYIDRGEGPALVFLHGNGITVRDCELSGLLALAERKYRFIAIDRPGFGYSKRPRGRIWGPVAQARLIHSALGNIGVTRPIVFGHSWGAMVALAYGLEFSRETQALVLASGYYFPTFRLDALLAAPPAIPVLGALLAHTVDPLIARLLWPLVVKHVFAPAAVAPQFERYPKWMSLRPSQLRAEAAESALMMPAAYRLSRRRHELAAPVVLIAGDGDKLVDTEAHTVRAARELSGSQLRIVSGAGHMAHYTDTKAVMDAIDAAASMGAAAGPVSVPTAE